jgi:enamine deaminase RidA (YjgF/YER057c/UK114 family)
LNLEGYPMTKPIARTGGSPRASNVPVSNVVDAGDFIFTSAQNALDESGKLICAAADQQLDCALQQLEARLREVDASLADVAKLGLFYLNGSGLDETALLRQIRRRFPDGMPPAITAIPLSAMPYPGMSVQLDAIAARKSAGRRFVPTSRGRWPWPAGAAFSQAVRCGDVIFVSGQMALNQDGTTQHPQDIVGQAKSTLENMRIALRSVGADLDAVVKLNTFYVGFGTTRDWEMAARVRSAAFTKPGPGATGVPVPGPYPNGLLLRQDSVAILGKDGRPAPRSTSWPDGHWDWPIKVSFEQGLKLGRMIILGGQIARAESGAAMHPGDLAKQAADCMDYIQSILAGFGASTENMVKVTVLYATNPERASDDLGKVLDVLQGYFRDSVPALTAIPLEKLGMEDLVIEIEGIAIVDA